jgi:hypothetical protein
VSEDFDKFQSVTQISKIGCILAAVSVLLSLIPLFAGLFSQKPSSKRHLQFFGAVTVTCSSVILFITAIIPIIEVVALGIECQDLDNCYRCPEDQSQFNCSTEAPQSGFKCFYYQSTRDNVCISLLALLRISVSILFLTFVMIVSAWFLTILSTSILRFRSNLKISAVQRNGSEEEPTEPTWMLNWMMNLFNDPK